MNKAKSEQLTFEALIQKEELIQTLPPQANYLLALYYHSREEYEKSLKELLRAIDKEDQRWDLYEHLVYLGKKSGNMKVTYEKLSHSLSRYKDNPNLHYCSGLAYFLDGKISDAIDEFQRSVSLNPDYALARFSLGTAYLECMCSSNLEKEKNSILASLVHQEFSKAQQGDRSVQSQSFKDGIDLVNKGMYQQALEKLRKALEEMLCAELVFGSFEQASLCYFLDPELVDYEMNQKAIQELDNRIVKQGDMCAHNRLGVAYLLFLRLLFREAENCFEEAKLLAPKFQKPLRNLKFLQEEEKEFSDLFEFLRF